MRAERWTMHNKTTPRRRKNCLPLSSLLINFYPSWKVQSHNLRWPLSTQIFAFQGQRQATIDSRVWFGDSIQERHWQPCSRPRFKMWARMRWWTGGDTNWWFLPRWVFDGLIHKLYTMVMSFLITLLGVFVFLMSLSKRRKSSCQWEDLILYKHCANQIVRPCILEQEMKSILEHCYTREVGGHFGPTKTAAKVLHSGFY